jgi:multidrug resistance protein MdtO
VIETDRPTIAPGAERILHLGTTLEVFLAELRPTAGRLQATVRATIAVMAGVVLAAMVGNPAFVMCPVTAMTESTPGTVHSPRLLAQRVMLSFLCAGASILIVASVPQAQPVLYLGILALVWCVMYLARVLPVGSSGLRVAIWTLGQTFSVPLVDPANFEQAAMLSALGVSTGVLISHAATLLIFPGAECLRARQAVDGLLADSAVKLRTLAAQCRKGEAIDAQTDPVDESALAHIAVLTEAVRTYVEPRASFPELAPLTRMACISDAATVHLAGLAVEAGASADAREVAARVAMRMADLFDRTRGLSFERHWSRPGDLVPELDELAREAESLIEEGNRIIRDANARTDEITLAIAGFARRVGGTLRASLTDRPLPATFGTSALALPLGFAPAGPTGRAPSLDVALSTFNPAAATSAAAAVCGVGLAMLITALFLPAETGPAAIGAAFVMQSTIGGSGRRGVLRFMGTVLGGAMAILAMVLFAGGLQGLGWYVAILGTMTFVSAWIFVGSPRTNYAGLMIAAAWITAIVVDPQPAVTVTPALARIGSVMVSGLCVTLMVWLFATTSARAALMRSIADGWRRLADLMRTAAMTPVREGELDAWRRTSHLATGNLATTADLREQYAFERRLVSDTFRPVLQTLAEQQRALLLARALAIGRFHDHPLPSRATAGLDAALQAQARRLDRLSERFTQPGVGEAIDAPLPTPRATREAAVAAGCSEEDVARLAYRRDAIAMLAQTIDRAERLAGEGFAWIDGKLESVLEQDAVQAGAPRRAAMLATIP